MLDRLETLEVESSVAEQLGLGGGALRLLRAWPRGGGRLGLEYEDASGARVAGQWIGDGTELQRVAEDTIHRAAPGSAALVGREPAGVLLQARGADRRLPALAQVAAAPEATLVAHRPERRGVVRRTGPDGTSYAKVLRPERAEAAVAGLHQMERIAEGAFAVPRLLRHDREAGVMELSALPGVPLHELLSAPGAARALGCVGAALATLGRRSPPHELPHHGPAEEVTVLRRWVTALREYRPALAAEAAAVAAAVERDLVEAPFAGPATLHGDLHDKQLLITDAGEVGLLDLDGVARGEGALDLANLAAHLELRVMQADGEPRDAEAQIAALLEAAQPPADVRRRLGAYLRASRLRLACVYAFRPPRRKVAQALLELAIESRPQVSA